MYDFKEVEEAMLKFWREEKIYEKSRKKNAKGKEFYFLDGPPYTSGKIHIGHAWNKSLKDLVLRYRRMQGYDVWDRAGYDMHGLPTENAVQKKLGLKTKDDIAKYGVKRFVKECMNFSLKSAAEMNDDFRRFGVWMDFDNAYMPVKKEFISGQWAFFGKAFEQGRLYKGKKAMHWDAQSETALAKHELEYKLIKDDSIFLKFKKKDSKNEYFLIWTTTPWTIPFNLAIMVNPDVDYVRIKVGSEYWIIAKDLVEDFMDSVMEKKYKVVEEFKGSELEGQEYEHFLKEEMVGKYDELKKESKNLHTIILSKQYVDTSSGTGLVHCAPGCGPEDEEVGRKYGIEGYNSLNERGEFVSGHFKGWTAKEDDKRFVDYFRDGGYLLATKMVEHDYPYSWRSHKPVIFRTTEQWFLKTSDLVPKIMEMNKSVRWVPKKSGESYDRWSENLRDNSAVRQRFWGCPVPIWVNEDNEEDFFVVGSLEELEKLTGKKFDDLSIHKPWIDEVIIEKDGNKYKRIPDVSDVWIDSGTVSWNCLDNDAKLLKKYFPADAILEGNDQIRLWFSLLQICSSIMFNKTSYENVFVHGMILDFQGVKMSKSLGNIVSPYEVVDKFSSDIFRYYICEITAGDNINFNWEDIKQKQRNLLILSNIGNYLRDFVKDNKVVKIDVKKLGLEERYILSRLNSTIEEVTALFESYQLDKLIGKIEGLFLDLSRVYIKITRDKANDEKTKQIVFDSIFEVYLNCLRMFAPVCPLVCEKLWQDLREMKVVKEESVHLSKWPESDKKKIDKKLEDEFGLMLGVVERGFAERDKVGIGLKWPLASASVLVDGKLSKDLVEIVKGQLNVKDVKVGKGKGGEIEVKLDVKMTPELEAEGYAREISRKVQAARKKVGLVKGDRIKLGIEVDGKLAEMLAKFKEFESFIKERTGSKVVSVGKLEKYKERFEEKVKGNGIGIGFEKV
jgi:isoleucyl-tRNA synthetase|tara:strand:- start:443 stop:3307 length:2865 start_codon:yes stop_codon:yes gene_type:complete